MTNNSPFDDHIKKQLGNYQPEVPPHIWENIIAEKDKEKPFGFLFFLRNNKFILISLIFIVAVVGGILVHNIYKNDSQKNTSIAKQPDASQNNIIKDQIAASTNTNLENNYELNNKTDAKNNKENKPGNNIASTGGQNIKSNNADALVADKNENNKTNSPVDDKMTSLSSTSKTLIITNTVHKKAGAENTGRRDDTRNSDRFLSKRTTHYQAGNKHVTVTTAGAEPDNTDAITTELLSEKVKKKTMRIAGRSSSITENPGTENANNTNTFLVQSRVEEINTSPGTTALNNNNDFYMNHHFLDLNAKPSEKTFSFHIKNINLPAIKIPCPGSVKNGKRYFEIYGGPDVAFRIFSDTANSTYLQKRKESTHFSSAYSFGIRYTKVFNNAFSIRTGINFSQVNEKFKFEQGHIVQLVYIISDNGDTTGSYATTGSRYKTTHNRYRTLDIPLLVGYEVNKGRFGANINAGLVMNIYSWQKGDILDSAYQPVNITTGKSSSPYQFKTNAGIGVTGGISFYYRLTSKLHFLAEPYFRYNFSAANKSDITLKQKYTTAGLRIGLRMDF